MQFQSLFVSVP